MSLSVDKLSSVNIEAVKFEGTNKSEGKDIQNCESQKDSSKLHMTLACLATLGAGAIATVAGYRKGKVNGKALGLTEGAAKGELDTLKRLTTISFNDFKKIGSFDKSGKAMVDGKPFTGKITRKSKYGETVVTYKDGVKEEAIIPQWRGGQVCKIYDHEHSRLSVLDSNNKQLYQIEKGSDGSIYKNFPWDNETTIRKGNYTEKARQEFWVHKPDGTFMRCKNSAGELSQPNYKEGKPIPVRKVVDLDTGKNIELQQIKERPFNPGRAREHVNVDGKKVTVHYDNFGKRFSYAHTSEFDPKTGLTTRRYYELDETGKLVPTNKYSIKDVKKTGAELHYKLDAEGKKYDLCLDDYQDGNIASRVYNGSRYWTDLEQIQANIERLGLKIEL